eukprot:1970697-Pleurochrysis_carterae.AAC.2
MAEGEEARADSAGAAVRAREQKERAKANLTAAIAASVASAAEEQAGHDTEEQASIAAAFAASLDDIYAYTGNVPAAVGKAATSAADTAAVAAPIAVKLAYLGYESGEGYTEVSEEEESFEDEASSEPHQPVPPGQLDADIAAHMQTAREFEAAMTIALGA